MLGLALGCAPPLERSEGVRLMVTQNTLEPNTTFELRFDQPVASEAQVGQVDPQGPLTIDPPLPGLFVWLSPRSGVYTPSEAPRLATEYRLSLRRGFAPRGVQLCRRLHTPDFQVSGRPLGYVDAKDVPALPTVALQFNADVDVRLAASFIYFANDRGETRPAEVSPVTLAEARREGSAREVPGTWRERFLASSRGGAEGLPGRRPAAALDEDEVPGQIWATPKQPLPPAEGWRLVVDAGLPSLEYPRLRLKNAHTVRLGHVEPFQVSSIEAQSALRQGRRIAILLSKPLASTVGVSNLLDWVELSPPVKELVPACSYRTIELRGEFELRKVYRVKVKPGLPAEFYSLAESTDKEVTFKPLPPRLYFPTLSAEQRGDGGRRLELLSVNVTAVRLQAKALDSSQLIHALRGYRGYRREQPYVEGEYEPFKGLDFNLLAGRTVYRTNLVLPRQPEAAVRTPISWDEVVGYGRRGAVFLMAEILSSTPVEPEGATPDGPEKRTSLGAQTLVQLTDLGVYWRTEPDRLWATVFSYATGLPLAHARVRLLDDDGQELTQANTDALGLAALARGQRGVWLAVEHGADLRAVALDDRWAARLPMDPALDRVWDWETPDTRRVLLFSDRPVYRPGETLNLKAILRDWRPDGPRVPSLDEVNYPDRPLNAQAVLPTRPSDGPREPMTHPPRLRCYDARDRLFFETNLTFSALGSADLSVALPNRVRGTYRAELNVVGASPQIQGFLVEDFQPAAFEIDLAAPPTFFASDPVELPVRARYLHGRPVTRGKLAWSLEARDQGFAPTGWSEFAFCNEASGYPNRNNTSVSLSGETQLTNQEVRLRPVIPFNPTAPQPRAIDLLVELTDPGQETLSQHATSVRHSSAFYLGIQRLPVVLGTNQALSLQLTATRAQGDPAPPVAARVRVRRVEWHSVRVQGAGRSIRYQNEAELRLVAEQTVQTTVARKEDDVYHCSGVPAAVFPPLPAGQYVVEALAVDSAGSNVLTAVDLQVAGTGSSRAGWPYRDEAQIDLVPDRKSYMVGQVATILVKAPFAGTAFVGVERERVLRSFTVRLEGNAAAIQVPIQPEDVPNAFVSVFLVRGADQSPHQFKEPEYRIGYCALAIEHPQTRLAVATAPERGDYEPGQTVAIAGTVRDHRGQPVSDTEVVCYAVDEGVLNLTGYQTPEPETFFWEPRRLAVFGYSSFPNLLPEDPAQWRFVNKGYVIGDGGASSRGRLRKNFLACAYWNPRLRTDARGEFSARFTAPDSLTRYRVIAVAHNASGQFGHAEAAFRVHKSLMLEPALPRFAHVGDRLRARAVLHNQTEQALIADVALRLDPLAKAAASQEGGNPSVTHFTLSAGASATVDFPVEFVRAGPSAWTWEARARGTDAIRDQVQSSIEVHPAAPLLREVYLRRVTAPREDLLTNANPQIFSGEGQIVVTVANSRWVELGEAATDLLHYPYGCAEQTSSSLLPWIVLKDALAFLPGPQRAPDEVRRTVTRGIDRLLSMQTANGGLAFWPGASQPAPWVSAYGAMTLALARKAGYAVPASEQEDLLNYLTRQLRENPESSSGEDLNNDCLTLYALALAGRPQPSDHERLFGKKEGLSAESRALLALAVLESNGPREMALELMRPPQSTPPPAECFIDCPERGLALQLLAWIRLNPSEPRVETLVAELLQGQSQARWSTTQGNAWGLLALTDSFGRLEGTRRDVTGALQWAGEQREFSLPQTPRAFETQFALSPLSAKPSLSIANPQGGTLFTRTVVAYRPRAALPPRQDRGFALQRRYAVVNDEGQLADFKGARVGDRVLVTLTLEAKEAAHFVVVDDPLPALLEPLRPEFKTQETRASTAAASDWWSDFREFRQDRALFFRDHLPAGRHILRYLTRVRAAGTALAPSAKVEQMYRPDRLGTTEAEWIATRGLD